MNGHKFRHEVAESMREIVFGLEDSLVSTLGAVTGIAAGTGSTSVVILSGLVLVGVEALSMSAGSYLSSKSAMEAGAEVLKEEGVREKQTIETHPVRSAIVMAVFYLLGGLVPLIPYFYLTTDLAYGPSILLTGTCLFGVGAWSAHFSKKSPWRGGWQMVAISLGAAMLGFVIGRAVSAYY